MTATQNDFFLFRLFARKCSKIQINTTMEAPGDIVMDGYQIELLSNLQTSAMLRKIYDNFS